MVAAPSTPLLRSRFAAVALVAALAPLAGAQEPGTVDRAREALAICQSAADVPADERLARLAHGLELAELAIAERPDDPVAHFAAFCNRGRRVQLEGASFHLVGEIRRVRGHIDRTLELLPDWPDAVAGKGAMLLALPRLLGGSRTEGERLLRRALALDPSNVEVRRLLEESGASEPAGAAVAHAGDVE